MNKVSFVFCVFFIIVYTTFTYAKTPNSSLWEGDYFIKKETTRNYKNYEHSFLSINREYSVKRSYGSLGKHLFTYRFACDVESGYQEDMSFSGRGDVNIDVVNISIKGNDSVRFRAYSNNAKQIKKLIFANGFNIYGYGDEKNGEMSLRDLIPFLEKHKNIILECQNKLSKSIKKQQNELNRRIEKQQNKKLILWGAYVVTGIISFILFIYIAKYLIRKFKVAKVKTKELSVAVAKNVSERKNKKFEKEIEKKIIESAVDEIVRQTVKRAMSEGVDPSEIIICSKCKGAGCSSCSNKGWIVEK